MEIVEVKGIKVKISAFGHTIWTTKDSQLFKVLEAVEEIDGPFINPDIQKLTEIPLKSLSRLLIHLYRNAILIRTPGMVRTKDDIASSYIYAPADKADVFNYLVEDYIIKKLRAQNCENEIRAYYEIKNSDRALSSIELESRHSPLNTSLMKNTFVNAGLIKGKFFRHMRCYIFWNPERVKNPEVDIKKYQKSGQKK